MPTTDSYPLDPPAGISPQEIAESWRRELPEVPVESIAVVTPLWRIAKLLADDRRRLLARNGIDSATLDLLSTLRRSGAPYQLSTRQLAERSLVTAGAVSQRLTRAERDALVVRHKPTGRSRTVLVSLTPDGHRVVESIVDQILTRETELLAGLADGQREQLGALLAALLAKLSVSLLD